MSAKFRSKYLDKLEERDKKQKKRKKNEKAKTHSGVRGHPQKTKETCSYARNDNDGVCGLSDKR